MKIDNKNLRNVSKSDYVEIIKTLKRFETLGSKKIYLILDNRPILKKDENDIKTGLITPGHYGRLAVGSENFVWSFYKMLLRQKVMQRHGILQSQKRQIVNAYENGMSLAKLVKKYDQPPTSIMRIILTEYYNINDVKSILQNPEKYAKQYIKNINERKNVINDINWSYDNDVIAGADQRIVQEKAMNYEIQIGKMLKDTNIRYQTQESMVAEQEKEHGRAIATPDFLLLDKVYINDIPISWIDAKHYYGANLNFVRESLQKQIDRYNKLWGHGAIFFSAGFAEDLKLTGAMSITYALADRR
jgi:hypothetical protein